MNSSRLAPRLLGLLLHIRNSNLTNINRVIAIEVLGDFLHGSIPGFDQEGVDNEDLRSKEDAVDNVILPANGVEGNRVDVLVEEEGRGDAEVQPGETLGTETVGENFGGVGCHQTGSERKPNVSGCWYKTLLDG